MAKKKKNRILSNTEAKTVAYEKTLPKIGLSLSSCDHFKVPRSSSILRDIIKAARLGRKDETLRLIGVLLANPYLMGIYRPPSTVEMLNLIDAVVLRRFVSDPEEVRRIRKKFEGRLPGIKSKWKMPEPSNGK